MAQRRGSRRTRIFGTLKHVLTLFWGVLMPLVSVGMNELFGRDGHRIVDLGAVGTVAVLLSVATTVLHLLLSPLRRDPVTGARVHHPPASAAMNLVLLGLAGLGLLTWGYLALLFLPLLPLSIIALVFLGLGLCGLCPYGTFIVHLFQVIRGCRVLSSGMHGTAARAVLVSSLVVPILIALVAGAGGHVRRMQIDRELASAATLPAYSAGRMRVFAGLEGQQDHIVDSYMLASDPGKQALLAEAYLRLSDQPIHEAVRSRVSRRESSFIRPFWFIRGHAPLQTMHFWRF